MINSIEFGAEMPMLIRGFYFEGFDLSHQKAKRSSDSFFSQIENEMRNASFKVSAKKGAKAVVELLQNKISNGGVKDA